MHEICETYNFDFVKIYCNLIIEWIINKLEMFTCVIINTVEYKSKETGDQ